MKRNLRKLLSPRVYNGLSATVFCVTRKTVHTATGKYDIETAPSLVGVCSSVTRGHSLRLQKKGSLKISRRIWSTSTFRYTVYSYPSSTRTHGQFVPKSCRTQGQPVPKNKRNAKKWHRSFSDYDRLNACADRWRSGFSARNCVRNSLSQLMKINL